MTLGPFDSVGAFKPDPHLDRKNKRTEYRTGNSDRLDRNLTP